MDPDDAASDSGKVSKEKKKSRKSKSDHRKSSSRKSKKKSSSLHSEEGEWDKSSKHSEEADFKSEELTKSPSEEWDPEKFDKKAGERWKDADAPKQAQDLPSPAIENAPEDRAGDGDDWPFKKTYAVDEKRKSKSKRSKDKGMSAPRRVKSIEDDDMVRKERRGSTSKKEKKHRRKSSTRSSSSSGRRRRSKDDNDYEAAEISDEDEHIVQLKSDDNDAEDDSQEQDGRRRMKKKSTAAHSSKAVENDTDEGSGETLEDGSDEPDPYSGHSSQSLSEDASVYSDEDDEAYSYDFDMSGGEYDSAEDDYESMPRYFQTPGMMDYDEEIAELMHKANPEYTEQLNRRVHRKRDNVVYDQNMPMMTRQALMTRQASGHVIRQTVDASSIDRGQLGFRNDSFHGRTNGQQKPQRRGPGRRAPPRSKSSGLGTMALSSRRGGEEGAADDPRAKFRGRGPSSSFQRYANKPNNVARMSGRRPAEMDRSQIGAREPPRRGMVKRAKSTTALGRSQSGEGSALRPERRLRRTSREVSEDENDSDVVSSDDEDSDMDSNSTKLKTGPRKRLTKKPVDKQDMTVKRHRRKLHGLLYQVKMSVEMKELLKEVQKGEVPKSPIRALLMDEP
eukprot:scaffold3084_cov144-Cylindrotheca_fusiformis.AAC.69